MDPKTADKCIWYNGPYVFFYDGHCDGFNKELVRKMNKMASKYPLLKVHVIDWQKKKIINPFIKDEEMNKISLYFERNLKEEKIYPDEKGIYDLFKKAIDFYNKNIKDKANNVGIKISQKVNNFSDNNLYSKHMLNTKMSHLKWQKKYILSQLMEFKEEKKFHKTENKTSSPLECVKNNKHRRRNHKENLIYKSINKRKLNLELKSISASKEWFCDVKMTDLPCDLFQEISTQNEVKSVEIQNYLKQNSPSVRPTSRSVSNPKDADSSKRFN